MRRRDFITALGGMAATASWPLVARAQQAAMPVVGFLHGQDPVEWASAVAAFRESLGAAGYVEGRDVGIEFRWAQGHYDKLPALAATYFFRCTAYVSSWCTTRKCRRPRIISGY
jgi:putative tryptophan/tyrosine transport system substrate-binding protein